jgi:hypothetical protein
MPTQWQGQAGFMIAQRAGDDVKHVGGTGPATLCDAWNPDVSCETHARRKKILRDLVPFDTCEPDQNHLSVFQSDCEPLLITVPFLRYARGAVQFWGAYQPSEHNFSADFNRPRLYSSLE